MKKLLLLFLLVVAACSPARAYEQTPTETPPGIPQEFTKNSANATTSHTSINFCTVTAEVLHLRSGDGVTYPVIEYLYAGDVLTLNDTRGNWYEVTTPANVTGWINSNYCEKRKP